MKRIHRKLKVVEDVVGEDGGEQNGERSRESLQNVVRVLDHIRDDQSSGRLD